MNDIVIMQSSSSGNETRPEMGVPSSCSLKRKRPPNIEIPNVLREIPMDAERGFREGATQEDDLCFSGYGVGVFSLKGRKKFMEDTHKIVSCSSEKKGFFGVYDGHGGRKAAEFVAENLHSYIFETLEKGPECATKEEAIKAGYMKTDQEFLKKGLNSGACCVTALIEGKEIAVSNLGDCRAVLCRNGVAEALTQDHRAEQEDERKRIEAKGGYVDIRRGAWRVHGILAVSRSIGDSHLKDWVVAEPDTNILCLNSDMEYLVLASDGLWEEVGNQEAIDIVMRLCSDKKISQFMGAPLKENGNGFGNLCTSSPKVIRRSLIKATQTCRSPCPIRTVSSLKEIEDDFGSENECPPSKAPRISLLNQMKMNTQSPDQANSRFNKKPSLGGLVAACKELANLAVTRGSLDDITVMIIDLNCFKN